MAGSHEVRGSIPLGSTIKSAPIERAAFFVFDTSFVYVQSSALQKRSGRDAAVLRGRIVADGARGTVRRRRITRGAAFPRASAASLFLVSMFERTTPKKSSNSRLTLVFESV